MRPTGGPPLTFPAMRAIVQEIFTGYLLTQRPQCLKWIEELRTFSYGSDKVELGIPDPGLVLWYDLRDVGQHQYQFL